MRTERKDTKKKRKRKTVDLPGGANYLVQVFPPSNAAGTPGSCRRIGAGLLVGRDAGLDEDRLRVFDTAVSERHFQLTRKRSRIRLEDLRSTNGTFVNGRQVLVESLKPQDVIRAGDTLFVVTSEPSQDLGTVEDHGFVAVSSAMVEVVTRFRAIGRQKQKVFLSGETGTGKEVLARYLHDLSGRPGPFVAVNCAAIQPTLAEATLFGARKGGFTGAEASTGLIRKADTGTLFLDEIGEVAEEVQAKLLRFLDDGEFFPVGGTNREVVDVRIMAATNDIDAHGRPAGRLRQDLLARLEDEVVVLPPLRARREEVVPLLCLRIRHNGRDPAAMLTCEFVEAALCCDWPRNVRQLLKMVDRCMVGLRRGDCLDEQRLRDALGEVDASGSTPPPRGKHPAPSRAELARILDHCGGNKSRAARELGCHRIQLYRWIAKYGLEKERD